MCELIIKIDRNFCLRKVEDEAKYQIREIYTDFTNAVGARRKQNEGLFEVKLGSHVMEIRKAAIDRKET